jgi:hypothetical protein
LARLHANKAELLMVLDRPEIPLHTNGSENDIRCYVTRRLMLSSTTHVAIDYGRMTIMAPRDQVAAFVEMLKKMTPTARAAVLNSVNDAIFKVIAEVKLGNVTQSVAIDMAQDVAIWYANEIFEGQSDN